MNRICDSDEKCSDNSSLTLLLKGNSLQTLLQKDCELSAKYDEAIAFYHGAIDRENAEEILRSTYDKYKVDGIFLLRDCSSNTKDFSLSLLANEKCFHFRVCNIVDSIYSIEGKSRLFHGIEQLISYYKADTHGLPCKLAKFCKKSPPPNRSRKYGFENTLHKACSEGNYLIVKNILLDPLCPDVNQKDSNGSTALHEASWLGHDEIVKELLEHGALPNILDAYGSTALHKAALANHPSTIETIVARGSVNPYQINPYNFWIPLHEAAANNSVACINLLLEYGLPLRPRTFDNKTPMDLAREGDHEESYNLLMSYKPHINAAKKDWLHNSLNRTEAVTILKKAGCKDGMFLIRKSPKNLKNYVLSMCMQSFFFHYEITYDAEMFYINDGPYFESLEELVTHYSNFTDGLPDYLRIAINMTGDTKNIRNDRFENLFNIKIPASASADSCSKNEGEINSCHSTSDSCSTSSSGSIRTKTNTLPGRVRPNLTPQLQDPPQKKGCHLRIISPSKLKLVRLLGEGEFGCVWEGKFTDERNRNIGVAVKILKDLSEDGRREFLREAQIMEQLNHHCVVKIYGILNETNLMMVQELLPLGCMLQFIQKHKIPDIYLKTWAAQISQGMHYMECKKFVHRDLAARNVLVASIYQVKVSDFGLSRHTIDDVYSQSSPGKIPIKWYAPESIEYGRFTSKSDVWSYGVTLWEMFSYGKHPYGNMNGPEVLDYIKSNMRLERPTACPLSTYRLMLSCWNIDENRRPKFCEISEYFQNDPDFQEAAKLSRPSASTFGYQ